MTVELWVTIERAMAVTGKPRRTIDRVVSSSDLDRRKVGGETQVYLPELLAAIANTKRGGDRRVQG